MSSFCQCDTPELAGVMGSSYCFRCGLINLERKHQAIALMELPHPFEPADPLLSPQLAKNGWCGFCSFPRHDQRHA